jgi:hypothetical protein
LLSAGDQDVVPIFVQRYNLDWNHVGVIAPAECDHKLLTMNTIFVFNWRAAVYKQLHSLFLKAGTIAGKP